LYIPIAALSAIVAIGLVGWFVKALLTPDPNQDPTALRPDIAIESDDHWFEMFDGRSLEGWTPNENPNTWRVENGAIVSSGARSSLFFTGDSTPFEDFEFEADVMVSPGTNSGVYFRTDYCAQAFPNTVGYEAQINNTAADIKKTGGIWKYQDLDQSPVNDNEWFKLSIRVKGTSVTVKINETVTAELNDSDNGRLTGGKFALQSMPDGGETQFRNIRVRRL
jgi:hypothetical protein